MGELTGGVPVLILALISLSRYKVEASANSSVVISARVCFSFLTAELIKLSKTLKIEDKLFAFPFLTDYGKEREVLKISNLLFRK